MMVEVFRTTVTDHDLAARLVDQIQETFGSYSANFDLDDCDKVLRVANPSGRVESTLLIHFLRGEGIRAEILSDEVPSLSIANHLN